MHSVEYAEKHHRNFPYANIAYVYQLHALYSHLEYCICTERYKE